MTFPFLTVKTIKQINAIVEGDGIGFALVLGLVVIYSFVLSVIKKSSKKSQKILNNDRRMLG